MPVRDQIKTFEIRTRPTLLSCDTGTKDMQIVNVVMRILFRPVEKELATILLDLGADYDARLIPQIA
jgi:prohibitin 1